MRGVLLSLARRRSAHCPTSGARRGECTPGCTRHGGHRRPTHWSPQRLRTSAGLPFAVPSRSSFAASYRAGSRQRSTCTAEPESLTRERGAAALRSRISSFDPPVQGRGPGPGTTARLQPRPDGRERSVSARRSLAERRQRAQARSWTEWSEDRRSSTKSGAGNTQQPISARTDQRDGLPHDPSKPHSHWTRTTKALNSPI